MENLRTGKRGRCFPLYALVLALVINTASGRLNFGGGSNLMFPIPSELACENYPIVLRCPGTDVIQVVGAEYGRQNAETCVTNPENMRDTDCYMPEASGIMSAKCNNKTQCKVTVSNENFRPDPCPGTHKYLHVTFKCVKYMFGCAGTLNGIGSNVTLDSSMSPKAGSWVKDPLYNPDRVFFVSKSSRMVEEYKNTDQFLHGGSMKTHTLPAPIVGTSFVIYDGNVYFVKANRRIVKYSMLSSIRMKETSVPGYSGKHRTSQRGSMSGIELSVDEEGLWVIYTSTHDENHIVLSKLNKDTLQLEKTWRTTYPMNSAMHTFLICGVLYVVGYQSGNIEYTYNTNVDSRHGRTVAIGFDRNRPYSPSDPVGFRAPGAPASRRFFPAKKSSLALGRSFRNYNFSSVKYNPRERLLYAWDASGSNAVYYMLHFGLPQPVDANVISTTAATTTRTLPHDTTHPPPPPIFPVKSTIAPTPDTSPESGPDSNLKCLPTQREGLSWPVTDAWVVMTLPCPDQPGDVASWRCEIDQYTREANWASGGPDVSACFTWINELEQDLSNGDIPPSSAVSRLSRELEAASQAQKTLKSDEINSAARLMKQSARLAAGSSEQLTATQVQQLTEGISRSADTLIGIENRKSWSEMSDEVKHESVNDILQSVETAGFLLLGDDSSTASRTLEQADLLVQATVQKSSQSRTVTFPDPLNTNQRSKWSRISDRIVMPSDNMASSASQGVNKVVFSAYNNLGDFADAPATDGDALSVWKVDSRILSASLGRPNNHIQLKTKVRVSLENKKIGNAPRKCVYWSYSKSEHRGSWKSDGCTLTSSNATHSECACDHLTNFALLVNVAGIEVSPDHTLALEIITSVGICISLVCLAICIYTFTFFRNLQGDRNTIHKHLCLSLFVAELVFLVGIKQTAHPIPCAIVAGILHYTFLAAFMWMALEGFQLYVMLVEVFEGRSRWKWYYLTGYGIPAVIVCVSAVVDSSGYGSDTSCWLKVDSGFIWSFVGPVCAVILCNLIFLAITVFKMYRHTLTYTDSSKVNAIKASVRGASVLLCLLGITWAFGILWVWEKAPVMAYLFCIFNAFQGLCIFVFHCLLQKKVRTEYSRCFGRSACCRKRGQESYVSNSMSFSKQYTPGRYTAPNTTTHSTTLTTQTTSQSQLRRMWNETVVNGPRTSDSAINHSQDLNTMPNRGSLRLLTNPRMRCATLRSRGFDTTSSSIIFFYPHNDSPPPPPSIGISRSDTLMAGPDQVRTGTRGQRHSATQQFPSSSSPQLRRASVERLLHDVTQQNNLPLNDHVETANQHEDEVFLPAKAAAVPRDVAQELVGEDAYEYDRLQRHCHLPDGSCHRDCHQHYHSSDNECSHRHHGHYPRHNPAPGNPPRPHPRSMTMNPLKPAHQFSENEEPTRPRRQQFARASTLAQQPGRQWDGRRPSSPSRRFSQPVHLDNACPHHPPQERCQDACYGPPEAHPGHYRQYNDDSYIANKQRPTLEPLHSSRVPHRRRRSLNSSDSDEAIVNDFSASSSAGSSCGNPASLNRGGVGRSTLVDNIIHEHRDVDVGDDQPTPQERHREQWTPLYRDETDLEVQRLTDPNEANSADERTHVKLGLVDNQRDSAFYQSMNDLPNSTGAQYSSPSSGCSTEMASGDDDLAYHERQHRITEGNNPRYVLSPPVAFKSSRTTAPAPRKERKYEDMIIKSHDDNDDVAVYYKKEATERLQDPRDERYTEHTPNSQLLAAPRHHAPEASDAGRNSAGSGRMATCL